MRGGLCPRWAKGSWGRARSWAAVLVSSGRAALRAAVSTHVLRAGPAVTAVGKAPQAAALLLPQGQGIRWGPQRARFLTQALSRQPELQPSPPEHHGSSTWTGQQ